MTTENKINSLKLTLETKIENAEKRIQSFKDSLDVNPLYAFQWSNTAIESAALIHVFSSVLKHLNKGVSLEDIRETVIDNIMSQSRIPESSTSVTSNLTERYTLAAWAELQSKIKYL